MIETIGVAVSKLGEVVATAAEKATEISVQAIEHSQEVVEAAVGEIKPEQTIIIKPDFKLIKETSLKSLMAMNAEGIEKAVDIKWKPVIDPNDMPLEKTAIEKLGLTEAENALIIKETGWSGEIVEHIESLDQYEIYKNAELHEVEINGRKCLVKDINMDYIDEKTISEKYPNGRTNCELMDIGRTPYDSTTGERIELHHIGQDFDSPFAELCENSEHGDGNDGILHDKKIESWRQDPEKKNQYNSIERPSHWRERAKEL